MDSDQHEEFDLDVRPQLSSQELSLLEDNAYAASYNSHGKISRLIHVSRVARGTQLEVEALKLAAEGLKQTLNTQLYSDVIASIGGRAGPSWQLDSLWVQQTEARALERHERLERELNGYKTNLLKEAIRVGHTDLADFFYSRGDLQNAFKCYLRTRDYCTTSKHILSMCLNVIRVSLSMSNFLNVTNYVQKAEATPEKDSVLASKFKCAGALALIDSKKYKAAARKLTEVSAEMGNQFAEVLAAQDVATYGGLCALASFDRGELRRHVIDNVAFHEYLELSPEVREVVGDFYGARYAACLQRLARLVVQLRFDLVLGPHIGHLHEAIRSKAIVQYTQPFQTVHLPTMAGAFSLDAPTLERELAQLIQKGDIAARIDSHNKVLYARHANQRAATFSAALKAGEEYLNNTSTAILRASLLKHDLVQRQGTGASPTAGLGGGPGPGGAPGPGGPGSSSGPPGGSSGPGPSSSTGNGPPGRFHGHLHPFGADRGGRSAAAQPSLATMEARQP